jgi:hypothetical protein
MHILGIQWQVTFFVVVAAVEVAVVAVAEAVAGYTLLTTAHHGLVFKGSDTLHPWRH